MKQLVIDKEHPNGIIVEVEDEVIVTPFKDRVISRIREFYSIDDEIAIIRQKDSKPEEFAEYNAFVERVKAEERGG
jgi:hypothetical protein